jgi:hypothetical protein
MYRLIAAIVIVSGSMFGQVGDPPGRVARLNFVQGQVSIQPAGVDTWTPAAINYPMTIGDQIWVDSTALAEMHVGSTAIHVAENTAASFLNLDDRAVQIRLSQGSIYVRIRYMAEGDVYEVDTPNGAVSLFRTGSYRIDADPDNQTTMITVRAGDAEVTTSGAAAPVHSRQTFVLTGTDSPSQDLRAANPADTFDGWCMDRERREDNRQSARYVSTELPGYEDLDDYGIWRNIPGYGWTWTPRVAAGWAPYHYGHWSWIEPWGWTWVDDAPWGFAPYHYGRWALVGGSWMWIPGAGVASPTPGVIVAGGPVPVFRPVYAPALVVFVGGGAGAGVAWFPLGPREVYVPSYHVSTLYVNRVNVVNVTNVTNVRYVNQSIPGAVTAVPQNTFTSAQPVQRAAFKVPTTAVANAPVVGTAPPVAPTRQSFGAPATASTATPPASALNRPVMTRTTPPAAPVPFAARENALRANPGRPVDPATLSNLERSNPAQHPLVRTASGRVKNEPSEFSRPAAAPVTQSQTQQIQNKGFGRPANATSPVVPPAQQPKVSSEKCEQPKHGSKKEKEKERRER